MVSKCVVVFAHVGYSKRNLVYYVLPTHSHKYSVKTVKEKLQSYYVMSLVAGCNVGKVQGISDC